MKDRKKPARAPGDPTPGDEEVRDLFADMEDLVRSPGEGDDEEVLELDEVVDDGEDGLRDLPDLEDDLGDLGDLEGVEPSLDEPEAEESLFDEEVTVELAPRGKGRELPRKPLEETALEEDEALEEEVRPEEDLDESEEELPLPELGEAQELEAARAEILDQEASEAPEPREDAGWEDLGEPQPVETQVWDGDKELQELLKTADAGIAGKTVEAQKEELLDEVEPALAEPVPSMEQRPTLESERFAPEPWETVREAPETDRALSETDRPISKEAPIDSGTAVLGPVAAAAVFGPEPEEVRAMTSTERAEEKTMEERPAMFQPIVEALEKRLQTRVQAMVQKAVQEQLPGIVRRVLQEEIERLSKSLG